MIPSIDRSTTEREEKCMNRRSELEAEESEPEL